MHFLILSDGKKGHENQALGLVEALLRRKKGSYEKISISELTIRSDKKPQAVIAAGHRTHPFLLRFARQHQCPSIVIMKPTLPRFLFSQCLIPEHDLTCTKRRPANIIATKGALNRLPEEPAAKSEAGLIMLGGPSKHFHWKEQPLINAIITIVTNHPELAWTIGDSRRTPAGTLDRISAQLTENVTFAPHLETTDTWLIERLLESSMAWITPDSTSMLFEALTAGCQLGTLPLTARQTRLSHAHDQLADEGWLTPFSSTTEASILSPAPSRLHETGRCADLLLDRFFS